MAVTLQNYDALKQSAATVRDEKAAGMNTAERVGTLFDDIVEAVKAVSDVSDAVATRTENNFQTLIAHNTELVNLKQFAEEHEDRITALEGATGQGVAVQALTNPEIDEIFDF